MKKHFTKKPFYMSHFNIIIIISLMFFTSTPGFSQDSENMLSSAQKELFLINISQDTTNLLSGEHIIAKISFYDTDSSFIKYDIIKKEKVVCKTIDKMDIFSIHYADKSQNILYTQDSLEGYQLSVTEMKNFILGEQEAMKNYRAPWSTVFGFVTGTAAISFMGFWGVSSAFASPLVACISDTKIKTSENVNNDLKVNENFINGYKTYATQKKIKNVLFGSIIGMATVVIASSIKHSINPK